MSETKRHHHSGYALLFTMHSWKSFRSAGFHKIGEALAEAGTGVVFFSYPRPWYFAIKSGDIYGLKNIWRLYRGDRSAVGSAELINVTEPTWELPPRISEIIPGLNQWLRRVSEKRAIRRCRSLTPDPSLVILESTACLRLWPKLKQLYADATFVYRPSDPILPRADSPSDLKDAEAEVLKSVDQILLVNEEAIEVYARHGVLQPEDPRVHVLPNGFDLTAYRVSYPPPAELKRGQTNVVYVGASSPNWGVIIEAAIALKDRTFTVVCPVKPLKSDLRLIERIQNIVYIPGVCPDRVPEFVTNADVIMIPYPDNCRTWSRGLHSKVYQAMAAKKPIVGLNMGEQQAKISTITYAETVGQFVEAIADCGRGGQVQHDYDLSLKDWSRFKQGIQHILLGN